MVRSKERDARWRRVSAGRWVRQRVCSDAIGAELSRRILQEMLPWLDMSRVEVTANADFETRWRFDKVVGLSYFALVGDEPEGGAREREDDSHKELVNSWFVFSGSELPLTRLTGGE